MTDIAILVAAYNAAATLPQCLDSLCTQTLHDIQILCVDDCSTDNTLSLLRQRAKEDPRIKVLQTPVNSGQAVARNLALEHVQAPYVCMVDADDWLSPDALEQALNVFKAYPRTDSVLFQLTLHYDADGHEEDYGMPETLRSGHAITGEEAFELCLNGWKLHGLYVTRSRIHKAIPFDTATRLYSDDNTTCLHYLHSREVRACSGIYYYRRHEQSMTNAFHLLRFSKMEAMLSLLIALKKEPLRKGVLKAYEGQRWISFVAYYRLYLEHESELTAEEKADLEERFCTILHTFRPSRLPLRYRWEPGMWLTTSYQWFTLQQRIYKSAAGRMIRKITRPLRA